MAKKTTKQQDLELLEEMIANFETELDCDGYDIEQKDDVPYHFIIEDYDKQGWDYVHGAKRLSNTSSIRVGGAKIQKNSNISTTLK